MHRSKYLSFKDSPSAPGYVRCGLHRFSSDMPSSLHECSVTVLASATVDLSNSCPGLQSLTYSSTQNSRRTACDDCRAKKCRCTHGSGTATVPAPGISDTVRLPSLPSKHTDPSLETQIMNPPTPATTKKMKENARKAAQRKAKKEAKKKAPSTSHQRNQSSSSPAAAPSSNVPPSYLSTFSTFITPRSSPYISNDLPVAVLAEPVCSDDPGWLQSKKAAWGQAQKTVCIRWVQAKREKVALAEEALAAGRGSEAEVEVSYSISTSSLSPRSVRASRKANSISYRRG